MVEVHTQWFQTVFFLCVDVEENGIKNRVPKATGFFVRKLLDGGEAIDYMVTARHCINEARPFKTLYARFNKKSDGFIEIPTLVDDWITHPTEDVAAIAIQRGMIPQDVDRSELESVSITLSPDTFTGGGPRYEFYGEVQQVGRERFQPNVGHEIYFVGLFSESSGEKRNLPVARFGHIARMPSTIRVGSGIQEARITAYLVEFHSAGGNSGAPVFFVWPMMVRIDKKNEQGQVVDTDYQLRFHNAVLGLVSAHYELPATVRQTGDLLGSIEVRLNSGLAAITPADAIRELLEENEEILEQRTEIMRSLGK